MQVARAYLKAHADLFGVDPATLKLSRDYLDIAGTHHLSFLQQVGSVPVFGNGIRADVAKNGALIQMTGSPVRQVPDGLAAAQLTGSQALDTARRDARETRSGTTTPVPRPAAGSGRSRWANGFRRVRRR